MKSYTATDIGCIREINEDYIFASDEEIGTLANLYLMADGMGGHAGGEIASRFAVDHFTEYIRGCTETGPVAAMREAIRQVNEEMRASFRDTEFDGMGTTLVAACVSDGVLYVANVGDSRLYLMGDSLHQITRDHSWVEEMVSLGRLDKDSELYQQRKNVITRAIGVFDQVTPDFFEWELHPGDLVLLCSDGLTNMVDDGTIAEVLSGEGTLEEKGAKLLGLGLEAGGRDNISLILADPEIGEVTVC